MLTYLVNDLKVCPYRLLIITLRGANLTGKFTPVIVVEGKEAEKEDR